MKEMIRFFSMIQLFLLILVLFMFPGVTASEDFSEPPFEIGGSAGYATAKNNPPWCNEYYRTGSVTAALKIFRGFSLQGGYEGSIEEELKLNKLEYGEEFQLEKISKSYFGAPWIGLRYETSGSILKQYRFGISVVYAQVGYSRAKFGVTSTEWIRSGTREIGQPITKYHVASVSGMYGVVAARWRFDSRYTLEKESWLGAYGVDAGLKYTIYSSCTPRFDNIVKSDSDFSVLQVFIAGFIKLSFFQ